MRSKCPIFFKINVKYDEKKTSDIYNEIGNIDGVTASAIL